MDKLKVSMMGRQMGHLLAEKKVCLMVFCSVVMKDESMDYYSGNYLASIWVRMKVDE